MKRALSELPPLVPLEEEVTITNKMKRNIISRQRNFDSFEKESLSDCICAGFRWAMWAISPEGYDYWSDIHDKIVRSWNSSV